MRVLACLLALIAPAAAASAGPRVTCPHLAGSVSYERAGNEHRLALATCADRVVGKATPRPPDVRSPKRRTVTVSRDRRYVFYENDQLQSASIAADGLVLRVRTVATGKTHPVAMMLTYDDYWSWCGSTLILTAGGDRIATHGKRLVAANAPDWRPHTLWADPARAFGSVACAPDGRHLAVLSQQDSTNARFFATRWQLWQVGLDGSHTLLDAPPAGFADESPAWSPDGKSLLFVRERKGFGTLRLLGDGRVFGPLASLGYSLGFYGHHDWGVSWRR